MKINFNDKLLILLSASAVFMFIGLFLYAFIFSGGNQNRQLDKYVPIPFPTDPQKDYSNLSVLTPGNSTAEDLIKVNGKPASTETIRDNTYYYYKTPVGFYKNKVLIQNGIVMYASEYVFGGYRGNYDDYTASLGKPDLEMHDNDADGFIWSIYLKKGLAIEGSGQDLWRIVYFPKDNSTFFTKTVAPDLNMSENPESDDESIPESL